jgi:hypothetical protein
VVRRRENVTDAAGGVVIVPSSVRGLDVGGAGCSVSTLHFVTRSNPFNRHFNIWLQTMTR